MSKAPIKAPSNPPSKAPEKGATKKGGRVSKSATKKGSKRIKNSSGAIHASGKRKAAVARATIKNGKGIIKINNLQLKHYGSVMTRQRILEPLILAGDVAKNLDITVKVFGGGVSGQADAIRLAIARALANKSPEMRSTFLDYDRQLLVADVRRKEVRKPNSHGKARSKRQKSYR